VFSNVTGSEYDPPQRIRDAWAALLPKWEDPRAHRAFVQAAHAMGELAAAGRLYRIHLARWAEDERAQQGIQEILRLALLPCEREPAAAERTAPRRIPLRAAVTGALLLGGLGSLLVVRMLIGPGAQ